MKAPSSSTTKALHAITRPAHYQPPPARPTSGMYESSSLPVFKRGSTTNDPFHESKKRVVPSNKKVQYTFFILSCPHHYNTYVCRLVIIIGYWLHSPETLKHSVVWVWVCTSTQSYINHVVNSFRWGRGLKRSRLVEKNSATQLFYLVVVILGGPQQ